MPDLDGVIASMETQDKRVSITDILKYLFRSKDIDQKSYLQEKNENAIIKLTYLDKYLKDEVGIDLDIELLIDLKRRNVLSIKGRGRKDILETVKSMQNNNIEIEKNKSGGIL
jgi:hypothetical protein